MAIKSMTAWLYDQEREQKAFENELMSLKPFAKTAQDKEALLELLELSKERRHRIERSLEARAARSDPRMLRR